MKAKGKTKYLQREEDSVNLLNKKSVGKMKTLEVILIIVGIVIPNLVSLIVGSIYDKQLSWSVIIKMLKRPMMIFYSIGILFLIGLSLKVYSNQINESQLKEQKADSVNRAINNHIERLQKHVRDLIIAITNKGFKYDSATRTLVGGDYINQTGIGIHGEGNKVDLHMKESDINLSVEKYKLEHVYIIDESDITGSIKSAQTAFGKFDKEIDIILVSNTNGSSYVAEIEAILKYRGYSIGSINIGYSVGSELRRGIAADIVGGATVLYVGQIDEKNSYAD